MNERARAWKAFWRARATWLRASLALVKSVRRTRKAIDSRKPAKGARDRGRPPKPPVRKFEEFMFSRILSEEMKMLKMHGYSREESLALIAEALHKSPKTIEDMLYAARRRRRVRKPRLMAESKTGD